jgi:hypothetical protein
LDKHGNLIESAFIHCEHLPSVKKFLKISEDISYFGSMHFTILNLEELTTQAPISKNNLIYNEYFNVLKIEYDFINKKYIELEKTTSQFKQDYILLIKKN